MLLHWQHCSRVGVTWFTVYVTGCSVYRSRFLSLSLSLPSRFASCCCCYRGHSVGASLYCCTWPKCLTEGFYIIIIIIIIFTPWSRDLWQKLTGFQQVKKFHIFYEIPRFNTALTSARYLSLWWARSSQYILHNPLPEDPSERYPPSTPGSPKLSLS